MLLVASRSLTPSFQFIGKPILLRCLPKPHLPICRQHRTITMKAGPNTRVAAITGASGGIGEQTAIGLVRSLPDLSKLFLCCRNTEKGERVAQSLRAGLDNGRSIDITVVPLELEDTSSIISCASTIDNALSGESLDLLICNAGIMACPLAFTNNEGEFGKLESQFAVNHLSHALLTDRLLNALRRDGGARVVFLSSLAVSLSRGRKTAPVSTEKKAGVVTKSNYSKWKAYGDSKLAMSLYAKALSERESDIESVSLHPGVVQTELVRHLVPKAMVGLMDSGDSPGWVNKFFSLFGLKTAVEGAALSIKLSKIEEGGFENGEMYVDTGLKKAGRSIIPLLENRDEVGRVYEDVERYISSVSSEGTVRGSASMQSKTEESITLP